VACTGLHGANRLASNSLLEGLVFGARAARSMSEPPSAGHMGAPVREVEVPPQTAGAATSPLEEKAVRDLMWNAVGLVRNAGDLTNAVRQLEQWAAVSIPAEDSAAAVARDRWRLASLVTVGLLIARGALRREESRGGHFRSDFPERDEVNFKVHIGELAR